MTQVQQRIVETNGIRMHIAEQGAGPLVVLCHGFPMNRAYVAESWRWANLLLAHRPVGGERPTHVGVLLDNTPDYLFALGGAAFAGATVVGLNPTRTRFLGVIERMIGELESLE